MSYGIALIPRGSSWLVKWPCRRSCDVTMCSNVDSQCVSKTITTSGCRRSTTSDRSRCSPGTRLISLPSLICSRTSSGSMIVGTCATSPAPTTSPMAQVLPSCSHFARRSRRLRGRDDRVLHVCVEIEAPHAPLATDPGVLRPTERRVEVAHEEAIDPHRPGDEPLGDALGTGEVRCVDGGGKAEVGGVRERDRLILVRERLRREDRSEDLFREDL